MKANKITKRKDGEDEDEPRHPVGADRPQSDEYAIACGLQRAR